MTIPVWLRWTLLAMLGLVAAAAVSLLASRLVSERIGLASEPPTVGRELVPSADRHSAPSGDGANGQPDHHGAGHGSPTPAPPPQPQISTINPAPAPIAPVTPTVTGETSPSDGDGGSDGADD